METIQENLRFREQTGRRKPIAESHGDYIKSLVVEGKVKSKSVPTKENIADIMTKPLEWWSHKKWTRKILNAD